MPLEPWLSELLWIELSDLIYRIVGFCDLSDRCRVSDCRAAVGLSIGSSAVGHCRALSDVLSELSDVLSGYCRATVGVYCRTTAGQTVVVCT